MKENDEIEIHISYEPVCCLLQPEVPGNTCWSYLLTGCGPTKSMLTPGAGTAANDILCRRHKIALHSRRVAQWASLSS